VEICESNEIRIELNDTILGTNKDGCDVPNSPNRFRCLPSYGDNRMPQPLQQYLWQRLVRWLANNRGASDLQPEHPLGRPESAILRAGHEYCRSGQSKHLCTDACDITQFAESLGTQDWQRVRRKWCFEFRFDGTIRALSTNDFCRNQPVKPKQLSYGIQRGFAGFRPVIHRFDKLPHDSG
jgi:hypothetical protein